MNDTELDQILDTWQSPAPSPSLRRTTLAAMPPRSRRKLLGVPLRWAIAGTLAFGGFAVGTSIWGEPVIGYFSGESGDIHMRATRRVDPPSAVLRWWMKGGGNSVGETESGGLRASAYLRDRSAGKFYGYRFTGENNGDGTFTLTFAPFDEAALGRKNNPFKLEGEIVQAAPVPPPMVVRDGETFDVNVYVNGAERVYDRIQVSSKPIADAPKAKPGAEEKAYEAVKMKLDHPRVYINGSLGCEESQVASGGAVWVAVPGEGRYLIAVDPQGNARFVEAGRVNGTHLEFISDGKRIQIETASAIASGGDRKVYVFHQRSFEDEINAGASGGPKVMTGSAGPASMHK
jgi:hypothetical protein